MGEIIEWILVYLKCFPCCVNGSTYKKPVHIITHSQVNFYHIGSWLKRIIALWTKVVFKTKLDITSGKG